MSLKFAGTGILCLLLWASEATLAQRAEWMLAHDRVPDPRAAKGLYHPVYIPPDTTGTTCVKKKLLSITGDFNGDGARDRLTERYFDAHTGKNIRQIPDEKYFVGWLSYYQSETWLVSDSALIAPLKVAEDDWGLLFLANTGDMNGDGIDELALVRHNADFSNLASCWIYQYCNGTWKAIFTFGINELVFWTQDGFDPYPFKSELPGYLENRNGTWYYYDNWDPENEKFHDADWETKLIPLAPDIPRKYTCCG